MSRQQDGTRPGEGARAGDPAAAATDRRGFLRLAGLGTLAGGAAAISGTGVEAAPSEPEGRAGGYRETDHVRRAYETARF